MSLAPGTNYLLLRKKQYPQYPTEKNAHQHPRAKSLSVTVAATLILHMGLSACSNFSDTYPLRYQRLISKSIPRRKVFDGVTVQKFSLAG